MGGSPIYPPPLRTDAHSPGPVPHRGWGTPHAPAQRRRGGGKPGQRGSAGRRNKMVLFRGRTPRPTRGMCPEHVVCPPGLSPWGAVWGPPQIPKCLENGPFGDQKLVQNGSQKHGRVSQMDPGGRRAIDRSRTSSGGPGRSAIGRVVRRPMMSGCAAAAGALSHMCIGGSAGGTGALRPGRGGGGGEVVLPDQRGPGGVSTPGPRSPPPPAGQGSWRGPPKGRGGGGRGPQALPCALRPVGGPAPVVQPKDLKPGGVVGPIRHGSRSHMGTVLGLRGMFDWALEGHPPERWGYLSGRGLPRPPRYAPQT